LLVIVGGDGTVQGVLCHLFATQQPAQWPLLAIVPGGTTNMTALDLGHSGSPELILQQLKDSLLKRTSPVLASARTVRRAGRGAKVYGMFFGVGLIARAVIFSQSRIKQLGITGRDLFRHYYGWLPGWCTVRIPHRGMGPVQMAIMDRDTEIHRGSFAFLLPVPLIGCCLGCDRTGAGAGAVACDFCSTAAQSLAFAGAVTFGPGGSP
jgi:hypothetical protein